MQQPPPLEDEEVEEDDNGCDDVEREEVVQRYCPYKRVELPPFSTDIECDLAWLLHLSCFCLCHKCCARAPPPACSQALEKCRSLHRKTASHRTCALYCLL